METRPLFICRHGEISEREKTAFMIPHYETDDNDSVSN